MENPYRFGSRASIEFNAKYDLLKTIQRWKGQTGDDVVVAMLNDIAKVVKYNWSIDTYRITTNEW